MPLFSEACTTYAVRSLGSFHVGGRSRTRVGRGETVDQGVRELRAEEDASGAARLPRWIHLRDV
ncbi:hypothetical protein AB0D07_14720, partial [Streptomyces globisporus]